MISLQDNTMDLKNKYKNNRNQWITNRQIIEIDRYKKKLYPPNTSLDKVFYLANILCDRKF
jgi:hypothetical protein